MVKPVVHEGGCSRTATASSPDPGGPCRAQGYAQEGLHFWDISTITNPCGYITFSYHPISDMCKPYTAYLDICKEYTVPTVLRNLYPVVMVLDNFCNHAGWIGQKVQVLHIGCEVFDNFCSFNA